MHLVFFHFFHFSIIDATHIYDRIETDDKKIKFIKLLVYCGSINET